MSSLQFIAEQGVKVGAVLLDAETFGGKDSSLLVFGALAASDVYTYLVRRSDDLITSLAMGSESTEGVTRRS